MNLWTLKICRIFHLISKVKYDEKRQIEIVKASPLFDAKWYLEQNPDVKAKKISAARHYVKWGWKEGRNPSKEFDGNKYLDVNQDVRNANFNPLVHYELYGRATGRRIIKPINMTTTNFYDFTKYVEKMNDSKDDFISYKPSITTNQSYIKPIAFYLPQFHRFKENDTWYGKGFTEWTNVTKSIPLYTGHYQPHLPIDVGFYNLDTTDVFYRQIELAKNYGIFGFAFYYYWFSGRKLMEKPIYKYLHDTNLDFPFCLCWACENWSKLWDGGNKEVLIKSELYEQDAESFWNDILPFLKDFRYIKINNKPVILIYKPNQFDKYTLKNFILKIRNLAKLSGFDDLYLLWVITNDITSKYHFINDPYGFDGFVEFPPHGLRNNINNQKNVPSKDIIGYLNPDFVGNIYDIKKYIEEGKHKSPLFEKTNIFRGIFPMWDNSARKAKSGCLIFDGMNPNI